MTVLLAAAGAAVFMAWMLRRGRGWAHRVVAVAGAVVIAAVVLYFPPI